MDPANISALTIFIGGIAGVLMVMTAGRWLRQRAHRTEGRIDDIILSAVGTPLVFFLVIATIYYSLSMSTIIPPEYDWVLDSRFLMVVITLVGTWIIWSFVRNVTSQYEEKILSTASNEAGIRIYHFFQATFGYVIWIIAGLVILHILEVDVTPILAAGGIAGIAAGLAAKDILGNFFSGAVLAADQPFRVGDRIRVQDFFGDVVSIGPRSTRIETLDSQQVTIPNSILTNDVVTNYAEPDLHMKVRIPVGVAYGTDIGIVKSILSDIAIKAANSGICLHDPPATVLLLELGPSSLIIQLTIWINEYAMSDDVRDFINTRILKEFKEHGIEIPCPQMDVHVQNKVT
ncbi:MAG: mechanosensitive ion channel [Methanospirillum sp.]|nr:mechanosensitive ion channel [Methanospirillum sp.]